MTHTKEKILARYKDQTYTKKDLELTEKLTGNKFHKYIYHLFDFDLDFIIHVGFDQVVGIQWNLEFEFIIDHRTLEFRLETNCFGKSLYRMILLDLNEYLS